MTGNVCVSCVAFALHTHQPIREIITRFRPQQSWSVFVSLPVCVCVCPKSKVYADEPSSRGIIRFSPILPPLSANRLKLVLKEWIVRLKFHGGGRTGNVAAATEEHYISNCTGTVLLYKFLCSTSNWIPTRGLPAAAGEYSVNRTNRCGALHTSVEGDL
ncbi:hypothetical protein QTP88_010208 [Uroleucon formosanum]